jgi:hypothetical protein
MAQFIKSLVYLGGFTTLGYVLMKITEPGPEKIKLIRESRYNDPQLDESKRRNALLIEKLKEAANAKDPVYLAKKKEEVGTSQQPSKREIN